MPKYTLLRCIFAAAAFCTVAAHAARCKSLGNYGSLREMIVDASDASVPGAEVLLRNNLTGVQRKAASDSKGSVQLNGIPFGNYRLSVLGPGFQESARSISVTSPVPADLRISIVVSNASTSLDVHDSAGGLELTPTAHGTLDRALLDRIPVQNQATGLSEKLGVGIIGFCISMTGVLLGNRFMKMMIEEINCKQKGEHLISDFGFTPAKTLKIWSEYTRLYPGGHLFIYLRLALVMAVIGFLGAAFGLGIIG